LRRKHIRKQIRLNVIRLSPIASFNVNFVTKRTISAVLNDAIEFPELQIPMQKKNTCNCGYTKIFNG